MNPKFGHNNDGSSVFTSASIPISPYARFRSRIADLVDVNGVKAALARPRAMM